MKTRMSSHHCQSILADALGMAVWRDAVELVSLGDAVHGQRATSSAELCAPVSTVTLVSSHDIVQRPGLPGDRSIPAILARMLVPQPITG